MALVRGMTATSRRTFSANGHELESSVFQPSLTKAGQQGKRLQSNGGECESAGAVRKFSEMRRYAQLEYSVLLPARRSPSGAAPWARKGDVPRGRSERLVLRGRQRNAQIVEGDQRRPDADRR